MKTLTLGRVARWIWVAGWSAHSDTRVWRCWVTQPALLTSKILIQIWQKDWKQDTRHHIQNTGNVWLLHHRPFPLPPSSCSRQRDNPHGVISGRVYFINLERQTNLWNSGSVSQPVTESLKRLPVLLREMLFSRCELSPFLTAWILKDASSQNPQWAEEPPCKQLTYAKAVWNSIFLQKAGWALFVFSCLVLKALQSCTCAQNANGTFDVPGPSLPCLLLKNFIQQESSSQD